MSEQPSGKNFFFVLQPLAGNLHLMGKHTQIEARSDD